VEDLDEVEEEDDEYKDGRDGRGEGGAEEEDVGRDRDDMTNLSEDSKSGRQRRPVDKEEQSTKKSGQEHKRSLECQIEKVQKQ